MKNPNMPTIDPTTVPPAPIHTVVITSTGATIDGEPVELLNDANDRESIQVAVLTDLRLRAAKRGRPVRVTAKEPDGTVEHFILGPSGAFLELQHPHPQPPPAPAPTPQAVRVLPPPAAPPPRQEPAQAPKTLHDPADDWRQQAINRATSHEQHARAAHGPASEQAARWARVREELRTAPAPWAATTELWTAALSDALAHLPADSSDVRAAARTAYECWRQITDPAQAADTGTRLLAAIKQLDYPELLAAVEYWSGQAAHAAASMSVSRASSVPTGKQRPTGRNR